MRVQRGFECAMDGFNAKVDDFGLTVGNFCTETDSSHDDPSHLAVIIALANAALPHSDPRKITREKVEHMKAIAAAIVPRIRYETHIGFLEEFAIALEACLPPSDG